MLRHQTALEDKWEKSKTERSQALAWIWNQVNDLNVKGTPVCESSRFRKRMCLRDPSDFTERDKNDIQILAA